MKLSHYSGCGNDFVIIDDRQKKFDQENRALISKLCAHAGTDGLILLQHSLCADALMRYFNRDGSCGEMCGNGLRCFARYAKEKIGFSQPYMTVEISGKVLKASFTDCNMVRVEMGPVAIKNLHIRLPFQEQQFELHLADSGVPHLVIFDHDEIESIDVLAIGRYFRFHNDFAPHGANVNFVDTKSGKIRTYERGVEAETLACGTGCTAAAILLHTLYKKPFPITLQVHSGDLIEIDCRNGEAIMTGQARFIRDIIYV